MIVCQHCGKREGTNKFGDDFMSMNHGMYQMWCNQCVLIEQLIFAMKHAARVRGIAKELKEELDK